MPGVNRKTDGVESLARLIARLKFRIEDLERRTRKAERSKDEEIVPMAYKGTVTAARSTPYPVRRGGQVVSVVITARTTSGSSSTFKLRKNGTLVGNTITLPASTSSVAGYAGNVRFAPGDIMDVECLTVGSGLADLGGHVALKG